jgi:hypothetical protein
MIRMKTCTTLFILISLASLSASATIRTVSNDPNNPAQFTKIQDAVNAAVAGDTIYVNPSPTIYNESVTIIKKLVMIGGGYNSPNQLGYTTTVTQFFFNRGGVDPSGSVICGFTINSLSVGGGLPTVSNITVFRNRINSFFLVGNNWLIYNNILSGGVGLGNNPVPNNIIIQNNIVVNSTVNGNTGNSNFIIDHNLFIGSSNPFLSSVQFATITNNVFAAVTGSSPIFSNTTANNNFNNNIANISNISSVSPTNSFSGGPNLAAGNSVGTDPLFVNVPNLNSYDATFNYRLQPTSLAKNAGTDGTDLGIYGGSYPFPIGGTPGSGFDTSALPPIPQVTGVNIQNGTLAPGAQLKVTIQATVNN